MLATHPCRLAAGSVIALALAACGADAASTSSGTAPTTTARVTAAPATKPVTRSSARSAASSATMPVACADMSVADKHVTGTDTGRLTGVTLRRGECGEQIELSVAHAPANMGYTVSYQTDFAELSTGKPLALRGSAKLVVVVMAQAYDDNGTVTYRPTNAREIATAPASSGVRQMAWAGSFEGASMIGIGVDAKRPFTVSQVSGKLIVTIGDRP